MSVYSTYKIGVAAEKEANEIIQHRYASHVNNSSYDMSTTSTSWATMPLTVSITPEYDNSKIGIQFNSSLSYGRSATRLITGLERTVNGTTTRIVDAGFSNSSTYRYGWTWTTRDHWEGHEMIHYDTPNTTDEITYSIIIRLYTAGSASYLGHQYQRSFLSATEIKQ